MFYNSLLQEALLVLTALNHQSLQLFYVQKIKKNNRYTIPINNENYSSLFLFIAPNPLVV